MYKALTFDDVTIVPQYSEIISRSLCDTSTKVGDLELKIPIISSPMETVTGSEMCIRLKKLGCLGIMHRFMPAHQQAAACYKHKIYAAAVGTNDEKRIALLIDAGVKIIDIDVAHGHHLNVKRTIEFIRENFACHIMAGAVATFTATQDLIRWGADSVRVGVGGGSLCETRIRTGVGVPMISSLTECSAAARGKNVAIIADGGIRYPGDLAKAIAAGADAVILGSLLAGTKETPHTISKRGIWPNEQLYKRYSGASSLESKSEEGTICTTTGDIKYVEGNSIIIPYKGKVKRIIMDMKEGLQSAMSYVGAINIEQFKTNNDLRKVTAAGTIEAQPHLMKG